MLVVDQNHFSNRKRPYNMITIEDQKFYATINPVSDYYKKILEYSQMNDKALEYQI